METEEAQTKIVLVVDDQVEIRELLVEFLRSHAFVAIPVADGRSALVLAERLQLDLILLDLVLPDVHGKTLIAKLKELRPATPVVIISGFLTEETESECRGLGADEVFRKPLNLKDLRDAMFRLLKIGRETRRRGRP